MGHEGDRNHTLLKQHVSTFPGELSFREIIKPARTDVHHDAQTFTFCFFVHVTVHGGGRLSLCQDAQYLTDYQSLLDFFYVYYLILDMLISILLHLNYI